MTTIVETSQEGHTRADRIIDEKHHFDSKGGETEKEIPIEKVDSDLHFLFGVKRAELLFREFNGIYLKLFFIFALLAQGFVSGLDSYMRLTYVSLALNSFDNHSSVALVDLVNAVVNAAGQLVFSRLSDIFGRIETYILTVVLYSVGSIIQCQATNLTRYAAGSVIYNLGVTGTSIVLMIFVGDMSSTRWRMFYLLSLSYPYVIITWIYGYVMNSIGLDNWKWGIGMWAFIFPLCNVPLAICCIYLYYKARTTEEWKRTPSGFSNYKKYGLWKYSLMLLNKLDVVGIILMIVCLGCILVPLTIAGGYKQQWKEAKIIVPLVVGFVLLAVFIAYEHFLSSDPVMPPSMFNSRGVWPSLSLSFFSMVMDAIQLNYFYTVLLVSFNESNLSATRIQGLPSFVSQITGFFVGLAVVKTSTLKPFLVAGVSISYIGYGLMYHYRGGTSSHAGIIGSQCVIGIGNGFYSGSDSAVLQVNVSHNLMARVTGISMTLYYIGNAIGSAVGGAVWTQRLYGLLMDRLNNSKLAGSAYESPFDFIEEYTWGTPERDSVVSGYKEIQRLLLTALLCVFALVLISSLFTQDRKLDEEQSPDVQGVVKQSDLKKFEENRTLKDKDRNRFHPLNLILIFHI